MYKPIAQVSELQLFNASAGLPDPGLLEGEHDVIKDVFYFSCYQRGPTLFVSYGPTFVVAPYTDIKNDLHQELEPCRFLPKGKVLKAFWDQYILSESTVLEAMMSGQPSEVVISGYSKGGTHAMYLMGCLLRRSSRAVVCRVFDACRSFDWDGARAFNRLLRNHKSRVNFLRINRNGDPFPHLLPWILGRANPGKAVTRGKNPLWILPNMAMHEAPSIREVLEDTPL